MPKKPISDALGVDGELVGDPRQRPPVLVQLDGFSDLFISERTATGGDTTSSEVVASRSAIDRERGGDLLK
jgi:hypothetical protein